MLACLIDAFMHIGLGAVVAVALCWTHQGEEQCKYPAEKLVGLCDGHHGMVSSGVSHTPKKQPARQWATHPRCEHENIHSDVQLHTRRHFRQ
jgi:hypothetical protein